MKKLLLLTNLLILSISLFVTGCDKGSAPQQESGENSKPKTSLVNPTEPNPPLPKVKLWIGAKELDIEVASTPLQVTTGMMFRESLNENDGMIFVLNQPRQVHFYNKNVKIPLSIAYIGSNGKIIELHDLEAMDDSTVSSESTQIQFILEMNKGWFEKNGFQKGSLITTDKGALALQLPGLRYFR